MKLNTSPNQTENFNRDDKF